MKKYRANNVFGDVKVCYVERETESSVWIGGRRSSKVTDYDCYFDTFEEAKSHIISIKEGEVKVARTRLEHANAKLGNAKGLKEPKDD